MAEEMGLTFNTNSLRPAGLMFWTEDRQDSGPSELSGSFSPGRIELVGALRQSRSGLCRHQLQISRETLSETPAPPFYKIVFYKRIKYYEYQGPVIS